MQKPAKRKSSLITPLDIKYFYVFSGMSKIHPVHQLLIKRLMSTFSALKPAPTPSVKLDFNAESIKIVEFFSEKWNVNTVRESARQAVP
jgi:hypothetical protein